LKADRRWKRYNLRVFPVPFAVAIVGLILLAIIGLAIGALSGWLASSIAKCGPNGVLRDAFLGSFGFLAGYIGCIFMPWPRNTVMEQLEGGGSVATTVSRYQHPARVAVAMAILLPLLHEFYRFKRAPSKLT
jgi:hypothetical protein